MNNRDSMKLYDSYFAGLEARMLMVQDDVDVDVVQDLQVRSRGSRLLNTLKVIEYPCKHSEYRRVLGQDPDIRLWGLRR